MFLNYFAFLGIPCFSMVSIVIREQYLVSVRKFLHINKINKKEKTALRNLIKTKKDKLIRNDTRQKYE